jgi:phosphoenolpyruvate-protein phosphotransferase (PTS system enzyme I)
MAELGGFIESRVTGIMKTVQGKPVSPGYAQGHAAILGVGEITTPRRTIAEHEIDREIGRFRGALDDSYRDLLRLQERVQSELGSVEAEIFSAHLLFLKDPQFIERVERSVRHDRLGIESAIAVTVTELVDILRQSDNAYLRERTEDIRDLGQRLLRNLTRLDAERLSRQEPGIVFVARELLPSDLIEIDRDQLVGIVTEQGGETGHAAILARALGIPAVTGITGATRIAATQMPVLLDGVTGEVVFDPSPERLGDFLESKHRYEAASRHALSEEACECMTRDGVRIGLYANIGRPDEVDQVAGHHLAGVGLFRTEYLFLDEPHPPSVERQHDVYHRIAASLGGRPLVIRTLDLGGDKRPAFLAAQFEANPNLGIRGLRFSLLATQELFRTQIRALLRLSKGFEVQIMLPMVLGGGDLRQARSIIEEVAKEEGIAHLPPLGALVETPAAVFSIDEILSACDFISIGTNDLTQFILAADRNALALIDDYTVLHPAVLHAIRWVIEAAERSGKPATVCGEAAADPRVACLLVGLGVRRLSMSPVSAARVRYALRASSLRSLEQLARASLAGESAETVSTLITDALRHTVPEFREGAISV